MQKYKVHKVKRAWIGGMVADRSVFIIDIELEYKVGLLDNI